MPPPRTCISLGIRVIPPGSGLARSVKPVAPKTTIGHHLASRPRVRYFLQAVRDEALDEEIKDWRESNAQHD